MAPTYTTKEIKTRPDTKEEKEMAYESKLSPLWGSYRLLIAIFGAAVMCTSFASQTSMTSAMVCMIEDSEDHHDNNSIVHVNNANQTHSDQHLSQGQNESFRESQEWKVSWDSKTQGWVVSSFFFGYYVMQIPSGIIVTRLGPRFTMIIGLLATGVLHFLSVPAAMWSLQSLYVVRVLAGLTCGCMYPGTYSLVSNWSPRQETTILFGISGMGIDVGNSFVFALSLVGCETNFQGGWPIVFYGLGATQFLLGLTMIFGVTSFPSTHRSISQQEREYIEENRPHSGKASSIPICKIMQSIPVWAFLVTQLATEWMLYTLVTQGPIFLKDILKLSTWETNLISSVPFLVASPFGFLFVYVSDLLVVRQIATLTTVRKLNDTVTKIFTVFPIIVLGVLPEGALVSTFLIYVIAAFAFNGMFTGYLSNPGDMSPAHVGFLAGLGQTLCTWVAFAIPPFARTLTQEKTHQSWQIFFYITVAIQVFSLIFYALFASGEIQPWAEVDINEETPIIKVKVEETKFGV